jgi:hypothetical protein
MPYYQLLFGNFSYPPMFSPECHRDWKPVASFPRILCQQGSAVESTDERISQKIGRETEPLSMPLTHLSPLPSSLFTPIQPFSWLASILAISQLLQIHDPFRDFGLSYPFYWIVHTPDIHLAFFLTSFRTLFQCPLLTEVFLEHLIWHYMSHLGVFLSPNTYYSFLHSFNHHLIYILLVNLFMPVHLL